MILQLVSSSSCGKASKMTSKRKLLIVAVAIISVAVSCEGARILALLPSPSKSHMICYEALTKELAVRGHHLTVVSAFPQDKPVANYTDIAVPLNKFGLEDIDMFTVKFTDTIGVFLESGYKTCVHYFDQPEVQKLIHGTDQHFDLIIISMFFNECFFGFAHKYKVPVIGISPSSGISFQLDAVGNTSPYAYVPFPMMAVTDHMTFKERLLNTISTVGFLMVRTYVLLPQQDTAMRKYFSHLEPIPYVAELERKQSLLLLNNHVSIGFPRPYLPNTVEVGGMHIRPPKKLPQDLQKFLDEAKDGVIYFSMGSNLKISQMSVENRVAFVTAFSKLKQRVLWKSDLETLPGLTANVKLGKWLPQIDILAHPNVKVFITHGGLLSTEEAVYHGVPVIGIPIFADQDLNMNRAQLAGYGVLLGYKNITEASVTWALDTVLHQKSYTETIRQLSALFRDQPRTPLQQAVYWTEYVLRHGGASHMRSAALDLAWYQYFLLDVIGFLALCLAVVCLVTYKTVRAVKKCVCTYMCSKKKVDEVDVKQNKKKN